MNKQTFSFPAQGGIIPNIPNPENPSGEFHAGQEVDVDLDTLTVLATRLINAPAQNVSIDEQPIQQLASTKEANTSKQKGAKG